MRDAKPATVIESLASLTPTTSEAAMGSSFASAAEWLAQWPQHSGSSSRASATCKTTGPMAAQALLRRVSDALKNDQHVTALGPVLRIEQSKAIDLLTPPATQPQPPVNPPITPPVKPPVKPGKKVVDSGTRENLSLAEAEGEIARIRQKAKDGQVARVNVSWVIEE